MKTITTNGDIFSPPRIKRDLYAVEIAMYSVIYFDLWIIYQSLLMIQFLMEYLSLLIDYMTLLTICRVAAD